MDDPDPSTLLRDFKSYASRCLNRLSGKPASGTWWTEQGSKRKVKDSRHFENVRRYILRQAPPSSSGKAKAPETDVPRLRICSFAFDFVRVERSRGILMFSAEKTYKMLGSENLWETAKACDGIFREQNIPYAVCGGVAVCLHGYQRNTVDLDLIIRRNDSVLVKQALLAAGMTWDETQHEFRTPSGIPIQFLLTGDRAGTGSEVHLPEPIGDINVEEIEGLSVLRLSRLIEIKIACATGNLRRTHKDLADVVELIVARKLNSSFARFLHKSLRKTFRELVQSVTEAG